MTVADASTRSADLTADLTRKQKTWFRETLSRFVQNRGAVVAAVVLMLVFLAIALAPVIAPYSPIEPDTTNIAAHPSLHHLLGD